MIIWGWKSKPKIIGGLRGQCKSCKNKTIHGVVKLTDWFTLYFIPIIPFKNKLFMVCNACGYRTELKDDAKKMMLQNLTQLKIKS